MRYGVSHDYVTCIANSPLLGVVFTPSELEEVLGGDILSAYLSMLENDDRVIFNQDFDNIVESNMAIYGDFMEFANKNMPADVAQPPPAKKRRNMAKC